VTERKVEQARSTKRKQELAHMGSENREVGRPRNKTRYVARI